MDQQVNPLERDHSLSVVLPSGLEKHATVHGSQPVMDLLVTLCASYHLNPSDYTVEVLSPNKNNISFKPNSPIGSLEAEKIVLKPKGVEEKIRRPYMPEATVRLLINYNKCHKTVVRVNPRVPLEMLLPVVSDKCEFQRGTTVLLRDSRSTEPLDLTKTLNDHGLREVFAKDTAGKAPVDHWHQPKEPEAEIISPAALRALPKLEKKEKENTGFFSLFRRKKKAERAGLASARSSPGLNNQMVVSVNEQDGSSRHTLQEDTPKKRQAPQPPIAMSQSVPSNLSHPDGTQSSAESTLKRTKRRAPPPPCTNSHQELQADTQVKGAVDPLSTLEEHWESDMSSLNVSETTTSSPKPSETQPSSSSSRPSLDPYLPSFRIKDLSDARSALARVLTSSVSKGTMVKRLRNSATVPKLYSSSSFLSMTQRCPDNGDLCTELESVLTSKLPTEPEWEDPLQRKGLTTFKVVPSNQQKSGEPELALDVTDLCQAAVENNPESEAPLEAKSNQTDPGHDPYSPHGSDSETPLPCQEVQASDTADSPPPPKDSDNQDPTVSPLSEAEGDDEGQKEEEVDSPVRSELSDHSDEELISDQISSDDHNDYLQSPSGESVNRDVDQQGFYTDVQEAADDAFPPPPPPVFFDEDIDIDEEEQECTTASPLPLSQPTCPAAAPRPLDKMIAAPSRFAQAVALAVQRSRLQSHRKTGGPQAPGGPHSALSSAAASAYQDGA